ncbi:MAG: NAD-dependent dehydratase [Gallionellales bacterium RBG_16_56_9]|nr:MAG: NAD-dependent dehydratase [Gallionellales bacterium RBG_16_56_9]
MLIGSGLLAQAFAPAFSHREDVCIYAAGVSNSSCADAHEFARERQRLAEALQQARHVDAFVYFGTCSVADPEARNTPYVRHKLAMEQLVSAHPRHLILRLPQVAGKTPNPHTLLNFLYARISRSEAFQLWGKAKRNIIDVDDVAAIARQLIADNSARNITLNIANPASYPMTDIVSAMERVVGKRAIYDVVERGSEYPIDTGAILPALDKAAVKFGDDYLEQVIGKYYGNAS